jgi:protocatechuate 4,5-dioxygenase, alpha chain
LENAMRHDIEDPPPIGPKSLWHQSGSPGTNGWHGARCIAGTPIFDGALARRGYALNRLCFSLNERDNRDALLRDEDAYCRKFGLNEQQTQAVKSRNIQSLLSAGGNIYYLAKLAGCFGMNVQDIGAQQTGMSVEAFRAKLRAAGAT